MKIVNHNPWFFWILKFFFPHLNPTYTIVAFGDTIYTVRDLPEHLIVHEKVHLDQQHHSRFVGWIFFFFYIVRPSFRLRVEVEAYQAQWKYIEQTEVDANYKKKLLDWVVSDLSGPLYNNMITREEAERTITQKQNAETLSKEPGGSS